MAKLTASGKQVIHKFTVEFNGEEIERLREYLADKRPKGDPVVAMLLGLGDALLAHMDAPTPE